MYIYIVFLTIIYMYEVKNGLMWVIFGKKYIKLATFYILQCLVQVLLGNKRLQKFLVYEVDDMHS